MSSQKIILYGYKRNSKSLHLLETELKNKGKPTVRRSKHTTYPPKPNDIVLVWGANYNPNWQHGTYINTPENISQATNKLKTFNILAENNISIPEFTENINIAKQWCENNWIICRKLLRASGGRGIVLAKTPNEIVNAPLYVKYKRKDKEYRVHVFKEEVIDITEKKRIRVENRPSSYNPYIRNHNNGWIYSRDNVILPEVILQLAKDTTKALKLDFGAVDIIYNSKKDKAYVLEINTAPGLTGTTLTKYTEAILAI